MKHARVTHMRKLLEASSVCDPSPPKKQNKTTTTTTTTKHCPHAKQNNKTPPQGLALNAKTTPECFLARWECFLHDGSLSIDRGSHFQIIIVMIIVDSSLARFLRSKVEKDMALQKICVPLEQK